MISKYFNDVEKTIRNKIHNMPVINCVRNFIDYANTDGEELKECDSFEREYIKKLSDGDIIQEILRPYEKDRLSKMTKEELFEEALDMICGDHSGYYCNIDYIWDDLDCYDDTSLYDYIKAYMLKTLNDLVENKKRTLKEAEIMGLKSRIESCEETIKSRSNDLVKLKKELEELEKNN